MIIGHRQPDTDSIASAIGYAAFKNHAEPDRYIAARCGELNAETCFALEHFGLKAPVLIDNVHPRVSDLKIARIRVTQDVPALERELENHRRFRELVSRWLQLEIELSRLNCEEGRRRKG